MTDLAFYVRNGLTVNGSLIIANNGLVSLGNSTVTANLSISGVITGLANIIGNTSITGLLSATGNVLFTGALLNAASANISGNNLVLTNPLPLTSGGTGVTNAHSYGFAFPANTAQLNSPTATFVAMGLGSTMTFTPKSSGQCKAIITGTLIQGGSASSNVNIIARDSTGTAPAFGNTSSPGGQWGGQVFAALNSGSPTNSFSIDGAFNLTVGTAYWFDLFVSIGTANCGAYIAYPHFSIIEF